MKTTEIIKEFLNRIEQGTYQINKNGQLVRNTKILGSKDSNGYITHAIKGKKVYAHRLMFAYYHGIENLNPDLSINHINGNKLDNRKENLEQVSLADNTRHQWKTGLAKKGEELPYSKLTEKDVKEIKLMLKDGMSQYRISELYNVSRSTILSIHVGENWKDVEPDESTTLRSNEIEKRLRTDAKLTIEQIKEIKQRLKNKEKQVDIVRDYPVSLSLIKAIAQGRRYSEL